jgi:adenylate cyclase
LDEIRTLSALMLTDMVGYTRRSSQNEALALSLLQEHNRILREILIAHGGREIKSTGDGFLVEFPSALQAMTASLAIQRRLYDRNAALDPSHQFQVRIGLHIGDVVHREDDIFGDGVNITARIEPLAPPGGICVSEAVHAQVRNKIDHPMASLGVQRLKHLEYPIEIFRVILPWEENAVSGPRQAASQHVRLAVLPLAHLVAGQDDLYFTDGLTEELIYALSKVDGLRVIAQTSSTVYRGTSKSVREIGYELGVGTILEGSVRRQGDRVRITVQLIDTDTEEHLWSERYDRRLVDVFEIQSEIAQQVASGLKIALKRTEEPDRSQRPTEDVDAYTAYLRGRHFWQRRTEQGLLDAIAAFKEAIDRDPSFAKAYSGLSDAYSVLSSQGYESPAVALRHAQVAAEKAVALDPELAEAHASLGLADLQFRNDAEAAERRFLRALELNPSYASAHQWYSGVLYLQMRTEDAIAHAMKAVDLDPLTPIVHINAGNMLLDAGRNEEAKEQFERAIQIEPAFEGAYADLAKAKVILWDWHGAEQTLNKALDRNPENASALAAKAILMLSLGRREEADRCMDRARQLGGTRFSVVEPLARYHRYLGQTDAAIEIYERKARESPENPMWPVMKLFAYLEASRPDEAAACLRDLEASRVIPHPKLAMYIEYARALTSAQLGDRTDAIARSRTVAASGGSNEANSARMTLHTVLGDIDQAFFYLDQAMATHDPGVSLITLDPLIRPLRSDPRYARALEVIGLAHTIPASL